MNTTYPMKSVVGVLLYIAMIARPDIMFAVIRIARAMTPFPKESAVTAAKRIIAYLRGTPLLGVEYTKSAELRFRVLYGKVAKDGGHPNLPDTVAFSDSDFAGCTTTFKSTSGSIIYHRGCPFAWQSRRQGCRAVSTCEAEYMGLYDTVLLSRSQGFLEWFGNRSLPLIFSDNTSALAVAKNSLVTQRSKHILLKYHTVREHFSDLCWGTSPN